MTGPALKLTEEQVVEIEQSMARNITLLSHVNARIRIMAQEWRTLHAALDEQVKENETWRQTAQRHADNSAENWTRATRAEAALDSANEITEEKVERVARAIIARRNLPHGCEVNWPSFKADARAALLAAQGKQPEGGGETSTTSHPYSDRASAPAPQSPDQACGAESDEAFIARVIKEHGPIDDPWHLTSEEGRRLIALASSPDTTLVRDLANQLSTARWLIMGHMAEADYDLATAKEGVASIDALLARPDVIAARKGGGE